MKLVTITKASDLAALNGAVDTDVIFATGIVDLPSLTVLKGLRNVAFYGNRSPKGRVAITGFPLQFIDCENVSIDRVAFHMERSKLPAAQVESWWSSPRFLASIPYGLKNISLTNCDFRYSTDEIAFFHTDVWPYGKLPVIQGLKIEGCLFGPSLRGLVPARLNHNFGLMVDGAEDVQIRQCVFAGNNRRNPQVRGKNILVEDCLMLGYGTMAIGIHAGSSVDVQRCTFWPTAQTTQNRPSPVKAVEGTVNAFGSDMIQLCIQKSREIGSAKHQDPKTDLNLWGNSGETMPVQLWDGLPALRNPVAIDMLTTQVGVLDTLSKQIYKEIGQGSVPWRDKSTPIARADYI